MNTQIYPIVLENKMFIGVGTNSSEIKYLVGETILNKNSDQEKELWLRANRVCVLEELETVVSFLVKGEVENAIELALSIKENLQRNDKNWVECIENLKNYLEKLSNINKG